MGYGKGKSEGGHKGGHSAMAHWVTHQEAKAEARKRRQLITHGLEREAAKEADGAGSPEPRPCKGGMPDDPHAAD